MAISNHLSIKKQISKMKIGISSSSLKTKLFMLTLLALGLMGFLYLRYITPYGLGLINDSVNYIGGAQNLIDGNGYSRLTGDRNIRPITNYPPLYSISIAALHFTGLEAIRAARLINLLLFSANILLTGLFIYKLSKSHFLSLIGSTLFLISEVFLQIHSIALTEPLYIFLSYIVLWALIEYTQDNHWGWLSIAGIIASLAFLTRYIGVSLYATTALVILVFTSTWRKKILHGLLFLIFGLPGVLAWSIRNAIVTGNPTNRQITYHPISNDKFMEGFQSFWQWLIPNNFANINNSPSIWIIGSLLFLLLMIAVCISMLLKTFTKEKKLDVQSTTHKAIFIVSAQGIIYLATLVFSLTFFDSSPIFEHRILSPFYICFFLLLITLLNYFWTSSLKSNKVFVGCITLLLLASFLWDTVPLTEYLHHNGQGFISYRWQNSETIRAAQQIPAGTTLYSNRPPALYILTNRAAYALLSPMNPATNQVREGYQDTVDAILEQVHNKEALLILFDFHQLIELPENKWIVDMTGELPVYQDCGDGVIFGTLE